MKIMFFREIYPYFLKTADKIRASYYAATGKAEAPDGGISVGLAGCGNFARYAYIPAFNKKGNPLIISGLFSNNPESSERTRKMLRYKTKIFFSYEELLDSGIGGVVLTLPNHLHYQYIMMALEAGLDVLCEKPVTNNLKDATCLNKYLENKKNVLLIGFNQRYTDRIKKVKSLIENEELGDIHEIEAFHNQDIAGHVKKSSWLNDSKKSGGGILYNAGIHLINLLLYFFGPIDAVSARLECKKIHGIAGEDTANCEFYFKSGARGKFSASYINEVDSSYEHLIIKGSKGSLYTDMKTSCIMMKSAGSFAWKNIRCRKEFIADSVFNELVHFDDCMEKRIKPDTDIADSFDTLKVVESAYRSSRNNEKIAIE